jgi:hypothetical protein
MRALKLCRGSALTVLCLAISAKAATYQITVNPQLLAGFYGSNGDADQFDSNFWSTLDTGANAPPMFGSAQITFTTADINSDIAVTSPNVQFDIPELNKVGPIPQGENLTPASDGWLASVLYIPGSIANPAIEDEVVIQIAKDATPGDLSGLQWNFHLFFPPNSMGVGDAVDDPNTVLTYTDFGAASQPGHFLDYALDSATSMQVPEPASLLLCGVLSMGVLRRRNRRAAV